MGWHTVEEARRQHGGRGASSRPGTCGMREPRCGCTSARQGPMALPVIVTRGTPATAAACAQQGRGLCGCGALHSQDDPRKKTHTCARLHCTLHAWRQPLPRIQQRAVNISADEFDLAPSGAELCSCRREVAGRQCSGGGGGSRRWQA